MPLVHDMLLSHLNNRYTERYLIYYIVVERAKIVRFRGITIILQYWDCHLDLQTQARRARVYRQLFTVQACKSQ